MKNKRNLLVTLADENYVEQAKQLFSSVYFNAGWTGDYMLLAHEIPESKLNWFRKKGILVKKCKPLYNKNIGRINRTPVVLDKFYLFTTYFKKWGKVVYLDADIIVRASLEELTKVKGFAAVRDSTSPRLSFNFFFPDEKFKERYNLDGPAFNSGVMAFSTDIIRTYTNKQLIELFKRYKSIIYFRDQPIFNLFFYKRWIKLPRVYNLFPYSLIEGYNIKPEKVRGIILHFPGVKPWITKNFFYNEWKSNLDKSQLINLKKIQTPNAWDDEKIKRYSLYKKNRRLTFLLLRGIGLFGIFLKKNFPGLYNKLKRLEERK